MQISLTAIYTDNVVKKIKLAYFKACVNKPAEFFDGMKAQAAARKLINEIEIDQGMGENY